MIQKIDNPHDAREWLEERSKRYGVDLPDFARAVELTLAELDKAQALLAEQDTRRKPSPGDVSPWHRGTVENCQRHRKRSQETQS